LETEEKENKGGKGMKRKETLENFNRKKRD